MNADQKAKYDYVVNIYDLNPGFLDVHDNIALRSFQDGLAEVLDAIQNNPDKTTAAFQLNKLGAVLIRLSFLLHCNRRETAEEFQEYIKNYQVVKNTLQLSVNDLI